MKKNLLLVALILFGIQGWSQKADTSKASSAASTAADGGTNKTKAVGDTTSGDKTVIKFDFSNWKRVNNQTVQFKRGNPFTITFENGDSAKFAAVEANSTLTGTYDSAVLNKKFSDFSDFASFDKASKTGTINITRILTRFADKDSVVLTIKKDEKDTGVKIRLAPIKQILRGDKPDAATSNTPKPQNAPPSIVEIVPPGVLNKYRESNFKGLYRTDVGFKLPQDFYTIHIFLDAFGNPLFGSIPSGIQNKYHYLVHILFSKNNEQNVVYFFKNISGSLSDAAVVAGGDVNVNKEQAKIIGAENEPPKTVAVSEVVFNFFPTSDELKFDVSAIVIDKDQRTIANLSSYSIQKTSFYSSALNIAGVYSWTPNPTFELVNSPVSQGKQTVKITDKTTGLMPALLYTVYWSPVNAIFKTKNREKLSAWGRTYLDDSSVSVLRKIYPAIGFGLKEQAFTNFLVGLNFQPVKELGIFGGANIRKINTFDMPDFVEAKTDVTEDQFKFYQNKKWKGGWVFGVVIDISIFNKILGNISTNK